MDHGAWPFFVGGVTCLVNSVSVVHGRSSLMESLVWLTPFLCVKRREKKKRKDERENEREDHR